MSRLRWTMGEKGLENLTNISCEKYIKIDVTKVIIDIFDLKSLITLLIRIL